LYIYDGALKRSTQTGIDCTRNSCSCKVFGR
jgi:hypothetical protein